MKILILSILLLGGDGPPAPADTPARRIALAIGKAARENSLLPEKPPEGKPGRLGGDHHADRMVRAALRAAREEVDRGTDAAAAGRALLAALGTCLDRSSFLEENRGARTLLGAIETPAERRERTAALAGASLRGRPDSLQHFVVSGALTGLLGKAPAWAAGIQKEVSDAAARDRGEGSGFSFADLTADQAGIEFAGLVLGAATSKEGFLRFLESREAGFRGDDFIPDIKRLSSRPDEGLGWKEWQSRFGSPADRRFLEKVEAIRAEVLACPGFRIGTREPGR
jgi:hypothetical protein